MRTVNGGENEPGDEDFNPYLEIVDRLVGIVDKTLRVMGAAPYIGRAVQYEYPLMDINLN